MQDEFVLQAIRLEPLRHGKMYINSLFKYTLQKDIRLLQNDMKHRFVPNYLCAYSSLAHISAYIANYNYMKNILFNFKKHGMKKNYPMAAFALLLLVGCSNDVKESDIKFTEGSGAKLIFSAVVNNQNESPLTSTRVIDTNWENGDAIGITCGTDQVNIEYAYTGGENSIFTATGGDAEAIWVLGSDEQDVTAYYPFSGTSGEEPVAIEVSTASANQATAEERGKINFLYAQAKASRENPQVKLDFVHAMSRIKLTFEADPELTGGLSDIMCYLIGLKTEGTFNPNTGITTINENAKTNDIIWDVINGDDNYTVEAILLPQTIDNEVSIQAGMSGYVYDVPFPTLTELKSGYSYNYTIKAKPYIDNSFRFEVTDATQIKGWENIDHDPIDSDPDVAGTDTETGNQNWSEQDPVIITPTEKN